MLPWFIHFAYNSNEERLTTYRRTRIAACYCPRKMHNIDKQCYVKKISAYTLKTQGINYGKESSSTEENSLPKKLNSIIMSVRYSLVTSQY